MEIETDSGQAKEVSIAGRALRCPHCENDKFVEHTALLNTRGMTLFNLEFLNQSAATYVCSRCGRIEWFADPSLGLSPFSSTDGDSECLECGDVIPHGSSACLKCGWSYVS